MRTRAKALEITLASILLALTLDSGHSALSESDVEIRDGVRHILNRAGSTTDAQSVTPKELWRVGGDSDSDEEFFGIIGDVSTDEDGNVYLLDTQLSQVKVFDADGSYLRTMGREGEGPGEFRGPSEVFFVPSGDVAVLQASPPKIVLFARDGTPTGEYPVPAVEGGGMVTISGARLAGERLVCMTQVGQFDRETGEYGQRLALRSADVDGQSIIEFHAQTQVWSAADPKFDEREWDTMQNRWAVGPGGRVFAATEFRGYEVTVWNPSGEIDRIIHHDRPACRRSDEEVARVADLYAAFTRHAPGSAIKISPFEKDVKELFTRDDGSVWVLTCGADKWSDDSMGVFDVFDREGKFVRQVALLGEGDSKTDRFLFVGDRLYVVTQYAAAALAARGGAVGDDEGDEAEPEPMAVICYQLDSSVELD